MILAVPEYDSAPASPSQWDRYYDRSSDKLYIQTLETTDPSYPNWQEIEEGAAVRDSMRRAITLTRSRYAARDYQTFLDESIAYIAEKWGDSFNDFMSSDAAMMFVEMFSAAFDQMSWYLDREVDDHYMELARVVSNVARLARYLGYKPQPSVASSVDVIMTLTDGPYPFDVTIRQFHKLQGPNGLIFELGSDQVISAGNTQKTIGFYQGVTYTEVFTSDGSPNQSFDLSLIPLGEMLATDRIRVTVDLDEWTENDFLPYGPEDAYEVYYLTSPPRLRFGDGVIGKKPPIGSEIRVQYTSTQGKSGGFAISGSVKQSITPVVVNFQTIPVSVTNPNPAAGGYDQESIESIKANAPKYFLAAERLVTRGDYEALAGSFSSISGAVAKANATIVRGIDDDLELLSLLAKVTSDTTSLTSYLNSIISNQNEINAIVGSSSVSGTIRNNVLQVGDQNDAIRLSGIGVTNKISAVQSHVSNSKSDVDLARTRLEFLPYQEVIGYGDGSTTVFAKTLSMLPIRPGSFAFIVGSQTPEKSATDGDCDTTPGRLAATLSPVFSVSDVGKMIKIGGQYRQIQKYLSSTTIEYSGPRIYGTSLIVDVLPRTISGYADSSGNIVASGVSGSVNWTTGSVSITFSVALSGVSGYYGTPIVATYQYIGESIQDILDNADADSDLASSAAGEISDFVSDVNGLADASDGFVDSIALLCVDIEAETGGVKDTSTIAKTIPVQIQNDVNALEEYLDDVLSSDCKANIVRVSCLTVDGNGFYTAPTQALKNDLQAYLDDRKIITVQNVVVGGDYYLVKVKLDIQVKILNLFTFQTVSANIAELIDNMFKGRGYGEPLTRKEYYGVIDEVDGIDYHNTEISETAYDDELNIGSPPQPDEDGNLFVGDYEVITKWEVNITQIEG